MRTPRILVLVLTTSLLVRPALGGPVIAPAHGLLANDAAAAREIAAERQQIAAALIELDRTPTYAGAIAARLTVEDLAVLAAYPEMLQAAGARDLVNEAYFWGAVIVAGIVVLAANGSGSVMVN